MGYQGCDEGYFDVQGYGEALDFCRWVGNGGCRKEPSWWSCKLAGTTEEYTPKGAYNPPNGHPRRSRTSKQRPGNVGPALCVQLYGV